MIHAVKVAYHAGTIKPRRAMMKFLLRLITATGKWCLIVTRCKSREVFFGDLRIETREQII